MAPRADCVKWVLLGVGHHPVAVLHHSSDNVLCSIPLGGILHSHTVLVSIVLDGIVLSIIVFIPIPFLLTQFLHI